MIRERSMSDRSTPVLPLRPWNSARSPGPRSRNPFKSNPEASLRALGLAAGPRKTAADLHVWVPLLPDGPPMESKADRLMLSGDQGQPRRTGLFGSEVHVLVFDAGQPAGQFCDLVAGDAVGGPFVLPVKAEEPLSREGMPQIVGERQAMHFVADERISAGVWQPHGVWGPTADIGLM